MTAKTSIRRRGVILTSTGYQKLQAAKRECEEQTNFGDRYTIEELSKQMGLAVNTIGKILDRQIPVDKQTLERCFANFHLVLERSDYHHPDGMSIAVLTENSSLPVPPIGCAKEAAVDWGEAPDVAIFYGRERELERLAQWVNIDRTRLVAILGMGGIGKTSLVTKLALQLQPKFEVVVWRSLRNAPLLENLLPELIYIFSQQTEMVPPTTSTCAQISRLLDYFRQSRCLLVLDNVSAILQPGGVAGDYLEGYTSYGDIFQRIGESAHQSCLVLTSREKPRAIVNLEGDTLPVRTMSLSGGLNGRDSDRLFETKGISVSAKGRARLLDSSSGNPLALKIVTTSICELFDGDIDRFLETETTVYSGIRQLLDEQFDRLSATEQVVMYWLAIDREGVSLPDLHADIIPAISKPHLLETVESLGRRSLIEHRGGRFSQQKIIMAYMTHRFIEQVYSELVDGPTAEFPLWLSHALINSRSPECLRVIQSRVILDPIASRLQLQFAQISALDRYLQTILVNLQTFYSDTPNYGVENLINLLQYLQIDLDGYDFGLL
jgi:ABC-type dipeptide/oligopeptide/nickel transport system ATPase subunit